MPRIFQWSILSIIETNHPIRSLISNPPDLRFRSGESKDPQLLLRVLSAEEEGLPCGDPILSIWYKQSPSRILEGIFLFSVTIETSFIRSENKKTQCHALGNSLQRRRDSNPRYLAVQRFSRPPHSTTLPLLCDLCYIFIVVLFYSI